MTGAALARGVAVFGGIGIDRLAQTAGPTVPGASNPGTVTVSPGGVGFNVATTLARLGLATRLVGIVGADEDGETARAAARAAGVGTDGISVAERAPTATYQAAFDHIGELVIGVADMRAYDGLTPADVASAASAAEKDEIWIVDANLPPETLDFLVGEAHATGRPVAALGVSPAKAPRLAPLVDRLTYLFANRREAAALLGEPDAASLPAATLAARLGRIENGVVVTDGPSPLAVLCAGEVRSFVPLRASVGSVNGAGDALAAGTIFGLATARDLFAAIRFGLAAAALNVERDRPDGQELSHALLDERLVASAVDA